VCAPAQTPPPSSDPWLAWWTTAPQDEREAVSVFWALLERVPTFAGDQSYPIAVMQDGESGSDGYCNATEYADPGDAIQYVGFRIISDQACEFFSDIDRAVGGPGSGGGGNDCQGSAYGDHATWLAAAGARVLGRPWSPNAGQLANWTQGDYCGLETPGWTNAVQIVLIESGEFTARIQGMAAGAQPPWGAAMASSMVAPSRVASAARQVAAAGIF
jgi:hypothetical protein